MKLSVLTTCYNASAHLGAAIESVMAEAARAGCIVEHVVADGGSTDGTEDLLARYPHLLVDSRPDRGIYDGMNRAIAMASGDAFLILNADDVLLPGALAVAASLMADAATDIGTAGFVTVDADGGNPSRPVLPSGPPSFEGLLFGIPAINARVFRRRAFDRVGLFDLGHPIAADRLWLINARARGLRFAATPEAIYAYRQHAGSATLAGTAATSAKLWSAHVAMADALLATADLPSELSDKVRALRWLEAAKLAAARPGGAARAPAGAGAMARIGALAAAVRGSVIAPTDAVTAVTARRRWRGRHSDASPA
ncbi:MAG: glycosyltransferase [Hyphomicrobiaceae bacterium]|nr:glycosyltransferase [Hyphomicrobiaceae bacterium]